MIEPFDLEQSDFDHLNDFIQNQAIELLLRQDVQELIYELRQKLTEDNHDDIRKELRSHVKRFPLKSRNWEEFLWVYLSEGKIINPNAAKPTDDFLKESYANVSLMHQLENMDGVQRVQQADSDRYHQCLQQVGYNVCNSDNVALNIGNEHVALFLTKDATKDELISHWDTIERSQKLMGKGRNKGSEYWDLYKVASLYRRGHTTPTSILRDWVDTPKPSTDAITERIKKAGKLGFITK